MMVQKLSLNQDQLAIVLRRVPSMLSRNLACIDRTQAVLMDRLEGGGLVRSVTLKSPEVRTLSRW